MAFPVDGCRLRADVRGSVVVGPVGPFDEADDDRTVGIGGERSYVIERAVLAGDRVFVEPFVGDEPRQRVFGERRDVDGRGEVEDAPSDPLEVGFDVEVGDRHLAGGDGRRSHAPRRRSGCKTSPVIHHAFDDAA